MNGYKVCETLRGEGIWTPILMLTAKDGEYDEAEALDTGADDFLSKPFSYVVLLARLRALLRRGVPKVATLQIGSLTLDPARRTCRRGGREIELTRREFTLLEALMRRGGDGRAQGRPARRGVGPRVRGRSQHRRGLRRLPAPQDRRRLRSAHAAHGPRFRLPDRCR